jgi:hypothetical protein
MKKPFYQSKTFWGIMMSVIAPTITQLSGVDVTTGIDFLKQLSDASNNHYTLIQWLELVGQGIGVALTIYGTISSDRSPINFKLKK